MCCENPPLQSRLSFRVTFPCSDLDPGVPHAPRRHGATKYPLLRASGLLDLSRLLVHWPAGQLPDIRQPDTRARLGITLTNFSPP